MAPTRLRRRDRRSEVQRLAAEEAAKNAPPSKEPTAEEESVEDDSHTKTVTAEEADNISPLNEETDAGEDSSHDKVGATNVEAEKASKTYVTASVTPTDNLEKCDLNTEEQHDDFFDDMSDIPQIDWTLCPEVKRIPFYKDGVPPEFEDVFNINPNWDPSRMYY